MNVLDPNSAIRRYLMSVVILFAILPGCNLSIDSTGIVVKPRHSVVKPIITPDPAQDKIVTAEFRMLILYDSKTLSKLPLTQLNMITSNADDSLRVFADKNCVKVGGQPEWRFLDYRADLTGAWARLRDRTKPTEYPWLAVENGPHHWEGSLPKDFEALKPIVDKYAGVTP
jgi:hypothetical protein